MLPAYIDPFSNYRYYVPKQVQIAQYIQLLREMDMPLTMIKQFLERVETEPQEAAHVLQTYLRLFDARVALVHQTARKVSQLLGKQENRMSTQTERELCLDDLPLVESSQLLDTLKKVLDVSASVLSPDNYRLVGTTASLLHGAHTPSKGIDFLMRDHESVDALHLALSVFKIDSPPTYFAK
ncbi:hypothetical protein KFU94_60270 [Chloroflexi bacterium TSY]|nr:hypothetical protein [Chloroflexi bacterium TSY]